MTDQEILEEYEEEINQGIIALHNAYIADGIPLNEERKLEIAKGYKKKFIIGFRKGQAEASIKAAKQMLDNNVPIQTIVKYSGLTEEEILKLKE